MIRKISLIALLLFFAIPQFAFAQVEMCTGWLPKSRSKLLIVRNEAGKPTVPAPAHFFFGLGTVVSGEVYTPETGRPYVSPQAAIDAGLYFADSGSDYMVEIFGETKRCGAKIIPVQCYYADSISDTYFGFESQSIAGCPMETKGDPVNAHFYQSYSSIIWQQKRLCTGVTKTNYDELLFKMTTPKQVDPVFTDVFSMGWFWTDDDTNELASNWRSENGKTPMEVAFTDFIGKVNQQFCYFYSQWSIQNIGNIDFDAESTIINGKKWRQFYVEVIMQQHSCYDCGSSYASDDLWQKPSPADTTGGGGGTGGGTDPGGETGGDGTGETTETVCADGDTRAGCATLDTPPAGDQAPIPGIAITVNDPGAGNPSFASPWTLSGTAECPANLSFYVSGTQLEPLDFAELCGIISGPMRAVLLMIASLTALAIALPKP